MQKGEIVAERLRRDWSFTPVPSVILRDKEIPDPEKITYQYLVDHAGTKGKCWVSQKRLAKDRGKGLRTIERHIRTLKDLGLIEVVPSGRSSDTLVVEVSCLYTNPKVRYKASDRNPESFPVQNGYPDKNVEPTTAKNGGTTTAKNGGHKEEKEPLEEIKPDTTYPGTLPSGQAQDKEFLPEDPTSTGNILSFAQAVLDPCISHPEGWEMSLRQPHRQRVPPASDKTPNQEKRGGTVDPDGNPEGEDAPKRKRKSPTREKIHSLWHTWKWRIRGDFHVTVPGARPVGSDYGHLKNILNYSGGDVAYAEGMILFVLDNWGTVKEKDFRAGRMTVPTLALVDALKPEVHACIQTKSKFGGGQTEPQHQKQEGGRGVHRLQGGWDEMEEYFKERQDGTRGTASG